jgi:hypothetical protein
MFLAHRLKITFTSNLKLIIFFLVLHIVLLSLFKLLSLVASTRQAPLTSYVYLRLTNRPSASLHAVCFGTLPCHRQLPPSSMRTRMLASQWLWRKNLPHELAIWILNMTLSSNGWNATFSTLNASTPCLTWLTTLPNNWALLCSTVMSIISLAKFHRHTALFMPSSSLTFSTLG